jgi:hypothetical protein
MVLLLMNWNYVYTNKFGLNYKGFNENKQKIEKVGCCRVLTHGKGDI